jgi:hypothetical protein
MQSYAYPVVMLCDKTYTDALMEQTDPDYKPTDEKAPDYSQNVAQVIYQSVGIGLNAQHDHGVCVGLHGGSVHAYAAEVYQTFKTVQILLGEVVLGRESQSGSDSGSKVLIAEVLIEGHFVGDADHDGACQHDEHQSTTNNCVSQLFLLLLLVDRCHVVSSET